ncbi:hypothetical protein BDV06DRAFT_207419 [Aspergillus oleicola]
MTTSLGRSNNTLALWAVQLVQLIPEGSMYENTFNWPIGIVARELTFCDDAERAYIQYRLQALVWQFQMKNFGCIKGFLVDFWKMKDHGAANSINHMILLE